MTVIAFRSRPVPPVTPPRPEEHTTWWGTFRSPRGRPSTVTGHLRLQRLVIEQRGAVVTGIFTAELCEPDGAVIGVDSRRVTAPADLHRVGDDLRPVVRSLRIELLGIPVTVEAFSIEPAMAFPHGTAKPGPDGRRRRPVRRARAIESP